VTRPLLRDERAAFDPQLLRDAGRGERLHKALARAGVASRRDCELLVEEGRVTVNGVVVPSLPAWVDLERDVVEVDGRRVRPPCRLVHVMLNKPERVVSTASDEANRRTVVELVQHPSGQRLYPVGRLDFDTRGLLLLTNEGELAHRLTHPRYSVARVYRAVVRGRVSVETLEQLRSGLVLAHRRQGRTLGARRARAEAQIVHLDRDRSLLDITLHEGQNRQIRRLLARLGHPVKRLTRIRMGPLELKGVAPGAWRELEAREVRALRQAVGLEGRRRGSRKAS